MILLKETNHFFHLLNGVKKFLSIKMDECHHTEHTEDKD